MWSKVGDGWSTSFVDAAVGLVAVMPVRAGTLPGTGRRAGGHCQINAAMAGQSRCTRKVPVVVRSKSEASQTRRNLLSALSTWKNRLSMASSKPCVVICLLV